MAINNWISQNGEISLIVREFVSMPASFFLYGLSGISKLKTQQ
jgi:hypothetical protein